MHLQQLADGLWSHPGSLSMGLIAMPRRMTIVRLGDGSLWIHSPNPLSDALREEIDALGPVRCLVAPNVFHNDFLEHYQAAWPEAQLHAAPGLEVRRPELTIDHALGPEPPADWAGQLEQRMLEGAPKLNEVAFLHVASKTLLLTDYAFHVGAEAPFLTRLVMRLNGTYGRLSPTRLFKWVFAQDSAAVKRSINALCDAWDFERVTVAHGVPYEGPDAKQRLREAFARW